MVRGAGRAWPPAGTASHVPRSAAPAGGLPSNEPNQNRNVITRLATLANFLMIDRACIAMPRAIILSYNS